MLERNARNLPRAAIFSGRRFSEPALGIAAAPSFTIAPTDAVYGVGSCFARAVAYIMAHRGQQVTFGGLYHRYNAFNILQTVQWALHGGFGPEHLIELDNGRWFDAHGREEADFSYASREEGLAEFGKALEDVARAVRGCQVMVLTFGLVEVWRDTLTNTWLNLMPPKKHLPEFDSRFVVHKTRQHENAAAIGEIFRLVRAANPSIKFICSVSPIPLKATFCFHDVFVATSYGKATLRSALQEAIDDAHAEGMKHVDYFPSFEIVSFQRNNDVYKPVDKMGKPDCLHIREDFLDKTVKRVFSEAYLPEVAATAKAAPARLAG
ncbi:MAG: GSCFA domain-containing protein [Phycisphaerales bacterium]